LLGIDILTFYPLFKPNNSKYNTAPIQVAEDNANVPFLIRNCSQLGGGFDMGNADILKDKIVQRENILEVKEATFHNNPDFKLVDKDFEENYVVSVKNYIHWILQDPEGKAIELKQVATTLGSKELYVIQCYKPLLSNKYQYKWIGYVKTNGTNFMVNFDWLTDKEFNNNFISFLLLIITEITAFLIYLIAKIVIFMQKKDKKKKKTLGDHRKK
jgi:hypothetical protein